jgi:hypothetical protein
MGGVGLPCLIPVGEAQPDRFPRLGCAQIPSADPDTEPTLEPVRDGRLWVVSVPSRPMSRGEAPPVFGIEGEGAVPIEAADSGPLPGAPLRSRGRDRKRRLGSARSGSPRLRGREFHSPLRYHLDPPRPRPRSVLRGQSGRRFPVPPIGLGYTHGRLAFPAVGGAGAQGP